ncbi:hypothetical protein PBCV1_a418R [Paramecium bursaria Chlorella virus 1]|uniref:Uncharacterized protein n=1 Tax=Paramecium bursaria Chlorella virus 1 TaxID=10506 RepID=Q98470_PBCV1|nr:hypothetical protein PBCV1_a418R [Paramecium bursaria Chlorella virus 1]AAC96786.1 hypothetical protein [Paramecium bursaria Chlorella virus 1]
MSTMTVQLGPILFYVNFFIYHIANRQPVCYRAHNVNLTFVKRIYIIFVDTHRDHHRFLFVNFINFIKIMFIFFIKHKLD